jgi:hypothetical protein
VVCLVDQALYIVNSLHLAAPGRPPTHFTASPSRPAAVRRGRCASPAA